MTNPDGHLDPAVTLRSPVDPVDVLRRCGKTFYAASLMLPPSVRRELAVLYAFCRVVDDCGDLVGPGGVDHAHELLNEVERCLAGELDSSPIVSAFRELADRYAVPLEHARQLIAGVRSDLGEVRIRTEEELVRYAYRVASTVGLMMCRVLQVQHEGDAFAIDLGIAMQLTNISRDVREDALNDRIYLPSEWVDHESVARAVTGDRDAAIRVSGAVERALVLADRYYESADLGMGYLRGTVRPGIRAAAANYRAIGSVIRFDPTHALTTRVSTTGSGKLARSTLAVGRAAYEHFFWPYAPRHDQTLHRPLAALGGGAAPKPALNT
ncbi:MAG: phytoene/squalene synthase family protein [Planctomycetota bacterium]